MGEKGITYVSGQVVFVIVVVVVVIIVLDILNRGELTALPSLGHNVRI